MDQQINEFAQVLIRFVEWYESDGSILCKAAPEEIACCIRTHFRLPTPISMQDANRFVYGLDGISVYIQPGMENALQVRGLWISNQGQNLVLIDEARPDPSKIKSVVHEIGEQLLEISHARHPDIPVRGNRDREQWANALAAYVKMPVDRFLQSVNQYGLDLEQLKNAHDDTFAGVTRHIRDLIMTQRPFYFCRFEIVKSVKKACPLLAELTTSIGGQCVRVVDVVRTPMVNIRRSKGGALPSYNLPAFDHYRVLNPIMNRHIKQKEAIFFSLLEGCASDEFIDRDLFGDQQLCVLLVPYGKRETRGYWMLAVHPKDKDKIDTMLNRLEVHEEGELDWLFSWKGDVQKRPRRNIEQPEIPGLGDALPGLEPGIPFSSLFDQEPFSWPRPL